MTEPQKLKIARFLADAEAAEAVKAVLLASFLKGKGERDVHILAASTLAVEKLEEGWRELERHRASLEPKAEGRAQVGL